ncbi:unnamed protein product [Effrenium voratum]|uniref:Uncharacterized protein n=1 Tax=Effrenium voratum TaxID=2562239 RepID=A0AA36N0K1_9DINO|nr:unnamed protein product [Effrenium voratum]CAJ1456717.1 unnamed protein product [Effrenium voratum]
MVAAEALQSFELPAAALRIFQRAVQCISKLGKDAAVIFRAEELLLRGADDGHSSASQFVFRRKFFRSTPMTGASAPPVETKVVVVARQLLVALKGSQQKSAEGLVIRLLGQRIFLEFTGRLGGKVRHGVPLLETMPFLPGEPAAGPHAVAMAPSLLARVLEHCVPPRTGCEEITVGAAPSEGLRVKSEDLMSSDREAHRTEVLVQMSDLEACSLDPAGGEVKIPGRGLRDFARAAENISKDLDSLGVLDGSALLELRFGATGPVVCSIASASDGLVRPLQDFRAVLMVAVKEHIALPGAPTPVPSTAPASARRAQPRQGPKRRAVEVDVADFDAFPEHSQVGRTQETQRPPPTQPVSATPGLQLFTQTQRAEIAQASAPRVPPAAPAVHSAAPAVPPAAPAVPPAAPAVPPAAPAVPAPTQMQPSQAHAPGRQAAQAALLFASLSPAAPAAAAAPTLASRLQPRFEDSEDELIGADPDEVAFARGDQEEEAPDWFDCENLW